jgi:hypothetical protein
MQGEDTWAGKMWMDGITAGVLDTAGVRVRGFRERWSATGQRWWQWWKGDWIGG